MVSRLRQILLLTMGGVLPLACGVAPAAPLSPAAVPAATRQVLLVTTADWQATEATVQCLERASDGGAWNAVGRPIRAAVGRGGLGWGLGLHRDGPGPQKQEGDGKAPAGVYSLGTAFGYAAMAPAGMRVGYRGTDARDYFVDDVASPDYNQWRRLADEEPNEPKRHWQSCEELRRADHQYELAMVVEHNAACVPGRGSAIFLHVWREPGSPTSGCTAMAKPDLLRVLTWLDPTARPLLVQAPRAQLVALQLAGGD